jgi:hypothetical protein
VPRGFYVCEEATRADIRVLVDEAAGIVHLVVDDNVEVFLGAVLRHVRVGEDLVRHYSLVSEIPKKIACNAVPCRKKEMRFGEVDGRCR